MLDYVAEALIHFQHNAPKTNSKSTTSTHKAKIWRKSTMCQGKIFFAPLGKRWKYFIQEVTGIFIYYAR